MRFNINDYPGNYAMLVDSREDIESFCKILDAQGRTWVDGRSYREYMPHSTTCFFFNRGTRYTLSERCIRLYCPQYTLLRWSDFKNDAAPSITLNFEDIFELKTEKE